MKYFENCNLPSIVSETINKFPLNPFVNYSSGLDDEETVFDYNSNSNITKEILERYVWMYDFDYVGECVDGLPHGYGIAYVLTTLYHDRVMIDHGYW